MHQLYNRECILHFSLNRHTILVKGIGDTHGSKHGAVVSHRVDSAMWLPGQILRCFKVS